MGNTRELYLKAKYAMPILKTRWISDVFEAHLNQQGADIKVAALAVGDGQELPHLRSFTGPGATIHAFDILRPSQTTQELAELANVTYHREGIQRIDKVIRMLGGEPNLVICRAPRIIETVSKREIKVNSWWAEALAGYAQRVQGRGQMLITTYTDVERAIVAKKFQERGIHFSSYEKDLSPIKVPDYEGPKGKIKTGIDRFALVVR